MFGVFSVGDVAGTMKWANGRRRIPFAPPTVRTSGAARQGQLELLAGRDAIVQCLVQGADTGVATSGGRTSCTVRPIRLSGMAASKNACCVWQSR
jgi:hypothetical protein